jgi:succinate dehydrogenase flavin-adding protein (antitoxin of CptAB toxin-antitoxin module)
VLSWRSLTEQEFNEYSQLINDANNDILNRETKLAKAYDQIESNLTLIGVIKILLYEVS